MTHEDFVEVTNSTLGRCCDLLLVKAMEYNQDQEDRLAAFKQAAAFERTTPQRALMGMLSKHLISVQNMCDLDVQAYPEDKWEEKIGDAINYLLLLRGLVREVYEEASHEKH